MTTIKSNAKETKGKILGWAFSDGRKAGAAARKHEIERPDKPKDK